MQYKAIIFDMDGVIINSEKIWFSATSEILKRFGKKFDKANIVHYVGKAPVEAMKIIQEIYEIPGDPAILSAERNQLVRQKYEKELEFFPDFLKLIKKVEQANYKRAIATGSDYKLLRTILKGLPLKEYFGDHIYSSEDVNFVSKPDPSLFLYTAQKIQINPKSCIVIEDAPLGIQAAKNAYMYAIGVTHTNTREILEKAGADQVVDDLSEINLQ